MKERRYFPARELRMETVDGQRFLTGLAIPYNQLSEDLGGWFERVRPGAPVLRDRDIRHLVNHDPSQILGRTSAQTTELYDSPEGVRFRTRLGTRSYENDLAESVDRGDINQNSWAFYNTAKPVWKEERDGKGNKILVRELVAFDVEDISTVTYPAYTGTFATLEARSRSCFPEGRPEDVQEQLAPAAPDLSEIVRYAEQRSSFIAHNGLAPVRSPLSPVQTKEFRSITNSAGVIEIVLYGPIGHSWWNDDAVSIAQIKRAFDAGPFSSVQVRINSGGGDAFEGIAIYNLLRSLGKPVKVMIDGLAASAASIIAMAGDEIVIGRGAMMMIHDPWTIDWGNADDFRKLADWLDKLAVSGAGIYAQRSGQSVEDCRELMRAETWLTDAEAVAQGFATSIGAVIDQPAVNTEPEPEEEDFEEGTPAMDLSMASIYRNAPPEFRTRLVRDADGEQLPSGAFLLVGDPNVKATWKLPVAFKDDEKTRKHLRTARHRLGQMTLAPEVRSAAEARLAGLCSAHGIEPIAPAVPDTPSGLTFAASAAARLRAIQATLD